MSESLEGRRRRWLLTELELAKKIKKSRATLKRWRRERRGPPYIRIEGQVRYDDDRVDAWLDSHEVVHLLREHE